MKIKYSVECDIGFTCLLCGLEWNLNWFVSVCCPLWLRWKNVWFRTIMLENGVTLFQFLFIKMKLKSLRVDCLQWSTMNSQAACLYQRFSTPSTCPLFNSTPGSLFSSTSPVPAPPVVRGLKVGDIVLVAGTLGP